MQHETSPKVRLALIPLLSIIGMGAAIYLTHLYHSLHDGSAGFKSLCNLGEGLSCSTVALSKWAELAPGFPLSSFVAGWFLSLLIIGLLARSSSWKNTAVSAGILMSGFGSLYSIFLIVVMFGVLHNVCAFCIAVDAVNFLLFGIFWSMKSGPILPSLDRSKIGGLAAIVGISVFLVVLLTKPVGSQKLSEDELQYIVNQVVTSKVEEISIDANSIVMGDANAPFTIVEYSDFECPFCKRGATLLHNLQVKYPGQIRIVFKNFPLDMACNRILEHSMHKRACTTAKIALCAKDKGKFVQAYEKFFDEQEELTPESVFGVSAALGLNEAELKACVESEPIKVALNKDIEEGIKLKIESTPTLFINGHRMPGLLPLESWDKVFEGLRKK